MVGLPRILWGSLAADLTLQGDKFLDFATIAGIVTGFGLIIITISLGGELVTFANLPSVFVVIGGSLAATLVAFPMSQIVSAIKVAAKTFGDQSSQDAALITRFVELAQLARRDGILALDRAMGEVDNPFMKGGLEMAVDGTEPDTIRDIMETEMDARLDRHATGQLIFNTLGAYAPAFGMIGTLIGLINMLQTLDDPSTIGPSMSVALITTFYGSVLGNLVYLPMATKLKNKSNLEIITMILTIDGVLSIQKGVHPKNIERKLMNYIAPKDRPAGEDVTA